MVLYLTLGVLIGLTLACLALLALIYLKAPVDRAISQLQSKMGPKGKIIELDASEIQAWLDTIPTEA